MSTVWTPRSVRENAASRDHAKITLILCHLHRSPQQRLQLKMMAECASTRSQHGHILGIAQRQTWSKSAVLPFSTLPLKRAALDCALPPQQQLPQMMAGHASKHKRLGPAGTTVPNHALKTRAGTACVAQSLMLAARTCAPRRHPPLLQLWTHLKMMAEHASARSTCGQGSGIVQNPVLQILAESTRARQLLMSVVQDCVLMRTTMDTTYLQMWVALAVHQEQTNALQVAVAHPTRIRAPMDNA